ncbi:MATE family efflux transporter [Streptomyces sp. NPDC059153]|uniref:MATE family efflux transporter n=1 Tax=Streptomyces sp. NPDC059153 TaxID=3346743 RepID=UPI0036BC935E
MEPGGRPSQESGWHTPIGQYATSAHAGGTVAVNAGLNWVLIHGNFGLPRLGLSGNAVATSSGCFLSLLALYAAARKASELGSLLTLNFTKSDPATVKRLIGLGIPIAATYGSEAGFFSITALMAGSFGPAALAAHTAVDQLVRIVFQVVVGLSRAASIDVSRELALGRHEDARRIKNTALSCAAAVMSVVGVVYLTLPQPAPEPFLDSGSADSDGALTIATRLLTVTAFPQFFDCAQNIGAGLPQGLDDTRNGFRITLIGYWTVASPFPGSSPTRSASTPRESGSACSPAWRPQPYFCSAAARAPLSTHAGHHGAVAGPESVRVVRTSAAARPFTAWPRAAVRAIDARVEVRQGAACYAWGHLSESSRADEAERPCHKTCARTSLGHVQPEPGGKS